MIETKLRILIDTNVVLTYVSGRDDKYSQSSEFIMKLCAENKVSGFLAFHSLSTIWYVTRKLPGVTRREWLKQICEILTVIGADQDEIIDAIEKDSFADFEDCLQDKCAKCARCDYIITGNLKDFKNSEVVAISPDDLLEKIGVQ